MSSSSKSGSKLPFGLSSYSTQNTKKSTAMINKMKNQQKEEMIARRIELIEKEKNS